MTMRAQLSDEQLLAQRQARTGRAIAMAEAPTGEPRGNVDPGGARPAVPSRDPFASPSAPANTAPPEDGYLPAGNDAQQQLAAALGRLAPMQQQLEEYRTMAEQLRASNAKMMADMQAQQQLSVVDKARKDAESFDPFEGMSADELAMMDPVVIDAMRRSARAALAKATATLGDPRALIAQTLQERDQRAVKHFIAGVNDELKLTQLGNDPQFRQFLDTDDSADMLLNSFVQASDMDAAQKLAARVRTLIKRFRTTAPNSGSPRNPDPQGRLSAHMSRSGDAAAPGQQGQTRNVLTAEQIANVRRQATALSRQRKFAEANELLKTIS